MISLLTDAVTSDTYKRSAYLAKRSGACRLERPLTAEFEVVSVDVVPWQTTALTDTVVFIQPMNMQQYVNCTLLITSSLFIVDQRMSMLPQIRSRDGCEILALLNNALDLN